MMTSMTAQLSWFFLISVLNFLFNFCKQVDERIVRSKVLVFNDRD